MFKIFLRHKPLISFLILLVAQACSQTSNFASVKGSADGGSVTKDQSLVEYYKRLEKNKLAVGLLRQDGGGLDTPFDSDDITQAFEKLAFLMNIVSHKVNLNQI